MQIKWLRSALQDLMELAEYIAQDNPTAAGEQFQRVERAVQSLRGQPEQGRPSTVPGLRELVVAKTPFVVPYRVKEDRVEILAVFHGALDWRRRLDNRAQERTST